MDASGSRLSFVPCCTEEERVVGEREGKRRDEVKGRDGKYGKGENVRRLSRGLNIDRMIQALGLSLFLTGEGEKDHGRLEGEAKRREEE